MGPRAPPMQESINALRNHLNISPICFSKSVPQKRHLTAAGRINSAHFGQGTRSPLPGGVAIIDSALSCVTTLSLEGSKVSGLSGMFLSLAWPETAFGVSLGVIAAKRIAIGPNKAAIKNHKHPFCPLLVAIGMAINPSIAQKNSRTSIAERVYEFWVYRP